MGRGLTMDEISPACMRTVKRKARKDHACCECRRTIKAGTVYEVVSGIWDHEPSSFKTCPRCVTLRAAMATVNGWPPPPFTYLLETIREYVREEGRVWAVLLKDEIKNGARP